jgi:hypothetical protein
MTKATGKVELVLMQPTVSLARALKSIRTGTRALMVDGASGPKLLTVADILSAANHALESGRQPSDLSLGDVIAEKLLPQNGSRTVGDSLTSVHSHSLADATIVGHVVADMLSDRTPIRSRDWTFEMRRRGATSTAVITASERFVAELAMDAVICTCNGEPQHSFEKHQLATPGKCNVPHKRPATVTCRRLGDSP